VEKYCTVGRPQYITVWRMHNACLITKATGTLRICNTDCYPTATMVAHSHLTVNVICTLTVLSLFIPAPHLSQTLLPVCHHIPADSTVHSRHHQHLRSHMWHIERYALLILVLCLTQSVTCLDSIPGPFVWSLWGTECHCYRFLP
jgi:hypothetical protein